jgi:hypothetical protein
MKRLVLARKVGVIYDLEPISTFLFPPLQETHHENDIENQPQRAELGRAA